jgi:hypothetical protein
MLPGHPRIQSWQPLVKRIAWSAYGELAKVPQSHGKQKPSMTTVMGVAHSRRCCLPLLPSSTINSRCFALACLALNAENHELLALKLWKIGKVLITGMRRAFLLANRAFTGLRQATETLL